MMYKNNLIYLSTAGFVQTINDKVFGVSRTEAVAIAEAEKGIFQFLSKVFFVVIFVM